MLSIRDQETRFRQKVSELLKQLRCGEQATPRRRNFAPAILGGLLIGITSAVSTIALIIVGIPSIAQPQPVQIPEKLKPYSLLLERGQLDYFETEVSDRGRVAMYLIGGADEAFTDGDSGIVVRPVNQ